MRLKEISIGTKSLCCQCHSRNELAISSRLSSCCTWALYRMCTIHDDTGNNLEHIGNIAEVNHQIVIAETIATFRQPHFLAARFEDLLHRILHICTRQELCLLDVDTLSGLGGSDKQIGLTTQERRNLQHIDNLGNRCCLIGLVDIGQQLQTILCLDVGKHLQAFFHPRPAIGSDGSTISLVERCLEDNLKTISGIEAH